jgi:hypothetical protein
MANEPVGFETVKNGGIFEIKYSHGKIVSKEQY